MLLLHDIIVFKLQPIRLHEEHRYAASMETSVSNTACETVEVHVCVCSADNKVKVKVHIFSIITKSV